MRYIIVILFFLFPTYLYANPIITSTAGNFIDGQSISVNVSNINSDLSGSSVLVYEDMESGMFDDYWSSTSYLTIDGSMSAQRGNSTKVASLNFINGDEQHQYGYFTGSNSVIDSKWTVVYNFYLADDWDWGTGTYTSEPLDSFLSNIKMFRMWNPSAGADDNIVMAFLGWGDEVSLSAEYVVGSEELLPFGYTAKSYMTKGEWHQWKFIYGENSGAGATDGTVKIYFDGTLMSSTSTMPTRDTELRLKRPFIVGFSSVWFGETDAVSKGANGFYIDDVYVNNSWVRVEIGDNPVYDNCTHTEICEITGISGSTVTATVKLGTFETSYGLYLFYIDADGNTSSGYLINTQFPSSSITGTINITGTLEIL